MILSLFRRRRQPATVPGIYGTIVAQARLPVFYTAYGVPDTVNGRFDVIVLHLALVLRRLRGGSDADRDVSQHLFDHFCVDMEANLREIGIADLKVPKEMRKIGEAFYGRARAYDEVLDGHGVAGATDKADGSAVSLNDLAAVLARNIQGSSGQASEAAHKLAAYVRVVEAALAAQPASEISAGRLTFPAPVDDLLPGGR